MKDIIKAFDKLPWIAKILLCLPVLNIAWAVYRICKGVETKNVLMLVIGIFWIVFGSTILWVVDLICTIIWKKPTVLA